MIVAFTLALLIPQEPLSEGLARHLADLEVQKPAAALARRFAPPPRTSLKEPSSPGLLAELQRRKEPLLDLVLERLALPADQTLQMSHVQAMVDALWGRKRRKPASTRGMDLAKFQDVLEIAHRNVNSALGGRLQYHDLLPELQAAVDQLRTVSDAAQLSRDDLDDVTQRLKRMGKIEHDEIIGMAYRVVDAALALDEPRLLDRLRRRPTRKARTQVTGLDAVGEVLEDKDTSFGRLVVGGFGKNEYDCTQIDVIIDLGGDDVYKGPAGGTMQYRRLGVVLDLGGNDVYDGLNDSLGSATYGLGVLVDTRGDDRYKARGRAAGFGVAGVGVFLDGGGSDTYDLEYFCGGVGMGGVGVFADLNGNDVFKGEAQCFGVGLPGGVGVFADADGDDEHELRGRQFADPRGAEKLSVGFGAGVGLEGVLAGGIGLFVDGRGADVYRCAGLALGAGAQGGLGVFADLQGIDKYVSGTSSLGAAHRRGMALFVDAAGDDEYEAGGGLALGAAAHGGEAWFVDMTGDDKYFLEGVGLGSALQPGLAGFLDLAGLDRYTRQAAALPWGGRGGGKDSGGAMSLFLDDGGAEDEYAWTGTIVPRNGDVQKQSAEVERHTVTVVLADR